MIPRILLASFGLSCLVQAAPPNLLVIQTDEHNFRTLSCYRKVLPAGQGAIWGEQAVVDTPHIDSIAARGVLCTSFYATSPVCTPSRAAMMSGMSPHAAGSPTNDLPLKDEVVTFAEVLGKEGYATGFVGKWHLDGPGKPQWEPKRKFGWQDNRFMFNRGHWKKLTLTDAGPAVAAKNKRGQPSYDVDGADDQTFATDWLTHRAMDFVNEHKDKPFCLFLSIPDPHGPNTVRAPYDTMFDGVKFADPPTMHAAEPKPAWGKGSVAKLNQNAMQDYLGMVKCIDDNVGKLLAAMERAGVLENTVLVFTSDHGDLMGEHARHNKGVPYETSAGVAFLVAGPGVARGKVIGTALDMTDFGPTMLGLLGAKGKMEMAHGRDASVVLKSGEAPDGWKDLVCLRSTSKLGMPPSWVAAVSDRWKLVLSPSDEPWLFDLETDPEELKNVANDHPERVGGMAAALNAWLVRTDDPAVTDAQYLKLFGGLR